MHDEQQRQPDARTQQVLNRVRHIINKKNTQFILDHQHDSLAALSLYLRDCMEDIGHPPARVEVIGGDFLEFRFGSWQKAAAQHLRRQSRRIPEKSPVVCEPEDRARPLRKRNCVDAEAGRSPCQRGADMKNQPFIYRDNRALHEKKMNEVTRVEISRQNIEFILAHQDDSPEELAKYLRRCQAELGHVPAQSEILGGDLLALRFARGATRWHTAAFRSALARP